MGGIEINERKCKGQKLYCRQDGRLGKTPVTRVQSLRLMVVGDSQLLQVVL